MIPLQGDPIAEHLLLDVALQLGLNDAAGARQQGHGGVFVGNQIATAEQGDLGQGTHHLEAEGLTGGWQAGNGLLGAAGNQGKGQVLEEIGQIDLQLSEPAGVVHQPALGGVVPGDGLVEVRAFQGGRQAEDDQLRGF